VVRAPLRLKSRDAPTPAPTAVPAILLVEHAHGNDERSEGGTPAVVTIPDWAPLRAPKARGVEGGWVLWGPLSHGLSAENGEGLEGWKIEVG
jgi:hypothetical protein